MPAVQNFHTGKLENLEDVIYLLRGVQPEPLIRPCGFVVRGNGSPITTGSKGFVRLPYGARISKWMMVADQDGSVTVDIRRCRFAEFPPTVGDSIVGGNYPELSAAKTAESAVLTDWTTTIDLGDIVEFVVTTVDGIITELYFTLDLET